MKWVSQQQACFSNYSTLDLGGPCETSNYVPHLAVISLRPWFSFDMNYDTASLQYIPLHTGMHHLVANSLGG
jgi:hypothetical protein